MQPIQVIEEIWSGSQRDERQYDAAEPADIITVIERLNGKDRNLIVFDRNDRSLTIGGGANGQYVGNMAIGIDEAFYNLIDPAKPADGIIKLVVGGQSSAYPAREVVDKPTVIAAALYFAEHGDRSPDLIWEEQA